MSDIIPIFPLSGTILLPEQTLALNLFEPRYVAMGNYAKEYDTPIGMIQPAESGGELFSVGTAGKIVDFVIIQDGRIEMALEGTKRFKVQEEHQPHQNGFRLVTTEWMEASQDKENIETTEVVFATRRLMEALSMKVTTDAMELLDGGALVDTLSMHMPFPSQDKQLLLEANSQSQRFEILKQLVTAYSEMPSEHSEALH